MEELFRRALVEEPRRRAVPAPASGCAMRFGLPRKSKENLAKRESGLSPPRPNPLVRPCLLLASLQGFAPVVWWYLAMQEMGPQRARGHAPVLHSLRSGQALGRKARSFSCGRRKNSERVGDFGTPSGFFPDFLGSFVPISPQKALVTPGQRGF